MAINNTIPGTAAADRHRDAMIQQHHTDIQRLWQRLPYLPADSGYPQPGDEFPPPGSGGGGGSSGNVVKLGKTDASHAKGASGTISIYTGTAGSETDSGSNETAYNRFAAVASGKWVAITEINGQWYLTSAEC